MKDLEEKILKEFNRKFMPNKKYRAQDIQCLCGEIIQGRYYKKDYSKEIAFLKKLIKDVRDETLREVLEYQGRDMIDIASSISRSKDLIDKLKGAR